MSLFSGIASGDWLYWGIALLVGLPVLVIALGELAQGLRGSHLSYLARPLDLFRNSALFLMFTTVLLRKVVALPDTHLLVMVVDTAFWISVLNASLALVNALLFEGTSDPASARAPKLLIDLGRVFLVLIGAALIVSYVWKVDLTGLFAALGVGSVVIGLALQDTLGNVFSGVTMLSSSTFRIGSWIKIGDIEGQVRSVSWRSIALATSSGDLIEIPNSQIAKDKLRVLGGDKGWLSVGVELKVDYAHPPEKVMGVLHEAALATEILLKAPPPVLLVKEYEEGGILYRVVLYVDDFTRCGRARSEFLANLWYIGARAGLDFDLSAQTSSPLTIVMPADAETAAVPPTHQASSRDLVGEVMALGTFQRPKAALQPLLAGAVVERYRKGEVLMAPGHRGQAAFVVLSGSAQAFHRRAEAEALLWTYADGDLVLFKAFFRGGDAPFTVRCASDVEAIRIPIPALEAAISQDPHIAQQVEQLLTTRDEAHVFSQTKDGASGATEQEDRVQILKDLFTS